MGYIVALSDLVTPFVHFFPKSHVLPAEDWITIGVWAVVLLPLSLVKEVSSLQCSSTLGIISLVVLVISVFIHTVLHFVYGDQSPKEVLDEIEWVNLGKEDSGGGLLNALPIMLFAFSCQLNVYSIQSELEVPTMTRMSRIARGAILICLAIYIAIGVSGYLEFGKETKGNILLNYDPSAEPVMLIPFLGITLTVLMAFPMNIFPCRYTLNELVFHVLPEIIAERRRSGSGVSGVSGVSGAGSVSRTREGTDESGSIDYGIDPLAQPFLLGAEAAAHSSAEHSATGVSGGGAAEAGLEAGYDAAAVSSPPLLTRVPPNEGGRGADDWERQRQASRSHLAAKSKVAGGGATPPLFERLFDPAPTGPVALVRHVGSTLLITGSALILALVVPDIQVVFQLLGSSSSTLVCFIAPAFFALKVAHRSVARNDSVIIHSHLAPRCCGFRCSRLFACGGGVAASHQGGSPSERSSSLNRTPASGSTSGGILRPARGGAGTGGEMRTLPWMEEEVTLARVIAVGGVRGTAPQKRCCRCGGSLNRTVTVQLGDEGVLVQVDSDALDHAANPLPVSCVE